MAGRAQTAKNLLLDTSAPYGVEVSATDLPGTGCQTGTDRVDQHKEVVVRLGDPDGRPQKVTEKVLLGRILPHLPQGTGTLIGPGDDAAWLALPSKRALVCVDVLVEGVHFKTEWSSGADVGWRVAMANLADIAAMGGQGTALVVAVTAPGDTDPAWFEDLAVGLGEACGPLGVGVVGGDLSSGPALSVAATALGEAVTGKAVRRDGAQVGDVVGLAGATGWSAAGLACLTAGLVTPRPSGMGDPVAGPLDGSAPTWALDQANEQPKNRVVGSLTDESASMLFEVIDQAVRAYRRPHPPLAAGPAAAQAEASAMIDVSDGLLMDAGRIAQASGVDLVLDTGAAALAGPARALTELAAQLGTNALDWVLTGGEDHALLATFPAGGDLPEGWSGIGHCLPGQGQARLLGGGHQPVHPGWDHFAE